MSRFIRSGLLAIVVAGTCGLAVPANSTPRDFPGTWRNPFPFDPIPEFVPGFPNGWVFGPFDPEAPNILKLVGPNGEVINVEFCGSRQWLELPCDDGTKLLYYAQWCYDPVRECGILIFGIYVQDLTAELGLGEQLFHSYYGPFTP